MTTPNLDALAKLAPFQHHRDGSNSWIIGGASGDDAEAVPMKSIAAALNEWAELRAYHKRTEAGLMLLSTASILWPGVTEYVRWAGLWREPGQGAT